MRCWGVIVSRFNSFSKEAKELKFETRVVTDKDDKQKPTQTQQQQTTNITAPRAAAVGGRAAARRAYPTGTTQTSARTTSRREGSTLVEQVSKTNGRAGAVPAVSAAQPRPREVWWCKVQAGWATERAEAASAAAGGDGEVPTAGVNDGGVDSDDGETNQSRTDREKNKPKPNRSRPKQMKAE